jgi:hypothetical protein
MQIRRLKNGNDGWLLPEATWLRATRFRSEEHHLDTAASVAEIRNPQHPLPPLTLTMVPLKQMADRLINFAL